MNRTVSSKFIPSETTAQHGGWRSVYKFPNGYEASVVDHSFSYGLELAVVHKGALVYDTPITQDVVGHIENEEELNELLSQIEQLAPRQ